jgi:hypothetical protein
MIESALGALILAWVLALFGFDELVIQFVKEWRGKEISEATYYVGAFIIGLILGFIGK